MFHQFYTRLNEAGIARFNLFAKEWAENGVKTEVVASPINYFTGKRQSGRGIFWREKDGGVSVIRAYATSIGYRTFLGRLLSYFSFLISSFIAGLFTARPDVVIASSPSMFIGLVGYGVSVFRRAPFVFEIRDLWPDEAIELGFIKNRLIIGLSRDLERFLYRKARFIIVNSPGSKEFLIKEKNVLADKIGVVENPVEVKIDKTSGEAQKEKMGWRNKFVVMYSGNHSAVYDFDGILEAAKKLDSSKDILFVLVGDGRQKPQIAERVKDEGINNVLLLPPVPKSEVLKMLSAADLCIAVLKEKRLLKYIYATKLFDYMAAGKPVLLAMEGVSAKLVCERANSGVCVKPGDALELADNIKKLSQDKRKLKIFGGNGQAFVKENLDSKLLADRYLKLLKPIIVPAGKSD